MPARALRQHPPKPSSGDVILIPKQLRMEWTDVLALDRALSHAAFRVACVIGTHFNNQAGDTYVKQETIARVMGLSERTVWGAIGELERRGYLIVERRELGVRASDGRRVCGGRGVANTYRPAFERSQVAATNSGRKLAARCDLVWEERSQKPARKVATDCDPTLTLPTEGNSTGARSTTDNAWGEASKRLRKMIGVDVFASWFGGVEIEGVDEHTVRLSTPTKFIRDWLKNNYADAIVSAWRAEHRGIERVEIVARSKAGPSQGPVYGHAGPPSSLDAADLPSKVSGLSEKELCGER